MPELAELPPTQAATCFDSESGRAAALTRHAVDRAVDRLLQESAESGMPDDPYLRERCRRCRKIIICVEDDLIKEEDPQARSWLAGALSKLHEIERQLAGRPQPGTLKPVAAKAKGPSFPDPS